MHDHVDLNDGITVKLGASFWILQLPTSPTIPGHVYRCVLEQIVHSKNGNWFLRHANSIHADDDCFGSRETAIAKLDEEARRDIMEARHTIKKWESTGKKFGFTTE